MLTHSQRTAIVSDYRHEYKRQVYQNRPWTAEKVAAAFSECGDRAMVNVAQDWHEKADCQEVAHFLSDWRNENGLGLDQQELQLREVA